MSVARLLFPLLLAAALVASPTHAHSPTQAQDEVAFDQNLGEATPADLVFRDAEGDRVRFGELTAGKPLVLVLAWYGCENLCPIALTALAGRLGDLTFTPGEEFRIAAVSIDPREGPADARRVRRHVLAEAPRGKRDGWSFLTGSKEAIHRLADAVGFHYAWDDEAAQYAHPAGLVVLGADGEIARYLFGLEFAARDLKLALTEAGEGEVGTVIDQIALRCHSFDPNTGQYGFAVMTALRVAGIGSAGVLFSVIGGWWWRERRLRKRHGKAEKSEVPHG